jgi:Short C-terminal domain
MRGRGVALLVGMKAGENRAKQEQAAQQQAAQQAQQQAPAPAPAAPAPASSGGDLTAQLNNLNQMHASGALSDEEYAAAKKKLLG